jgi:predicted MFS family arabinose efflux permease
LATAIGGNAIGSILNGIFSDIYGISNTFFYVGIFGIILVILTQVILTINKRPLKI